MGRPVHILKAGIKIGKLRDSFIGLNIEIAEQVSDRVVRPAIMRAVVAKGHVDTGRLVGSWKRITRSTGPNKAVVAVVSDQPQTRILNRGGTIFPRVKKFLTVPIAPEAKGKRARDFPGAFVLRAKSGNAFLAIKQGDGLRLLFALRKSVRIPASGYLDQAADEVEHATPSFLRAMMLERLQRAAGAG